MFTIFNSIESLPTKYKVSILFCNIGAVWALIPWGVEMNGLSIGDVLCFVVICLILFVSFTLFYN